jgi:hypothetical protein
MGDSKQPNQGLSLDRPRYRCGSKDLGQEHRSVERQDHSEKVYLKVPMELMNLHKEVFLTTDIFFVNNIPSSLGSYGTAYIQGF